MKALKFQSDLGPRPAPLVCVAVLSDVNATGHLLTCMIFPTSSGHSSLHGNRLVEPLCRLCFWVQMRRRFL